MKTWTNSPEWQDPETGETTERGAEFRRETQMRLYQDGKAPHPKTLNLEEEDMSKFAKKDKAEDASAPKAKKVNTNALTKAKSPADKPAKKEKATQEAKVSNDDRKITLNTKENPKRAGTAAFDRFELYKKSKTVAQFYEAGGTSADIRADEAKGHITVA